MHKLIRKIIIFGTRILEAALYKGFIKSFGREDAEYLDQVDQRKSTHRIYDGSVIEDQNQKIDSNSKFTNDESTELIIEDLLTDEDSFVERTIESNISETLPQEILPEFYFDLDIESLPATTNANEDEWLTLDITNAIAEEDVWEGNLPFSAAIESLPTRQELSDLPDRLTRAERALQIALKIGEEFDWDKSGIKQLAIIFNRYWWSSSQTAMRRAIESGMTPKELILAEELRQIWYEHPEFWSALNKLDEIYPKYSLISWPTALKLIRSFNGYPQVEEIEALLNECLDRWINSSSLQHSFRGFYMYALYRVGAFDDLPDQDGWIIFDHYPTDETEFVNNLEQTIKLNRLGINIDPRAERYTTNSWDGKLVLLSARHGHEQYNNEDNQTNKLVDRGN